MIRNYLRTRDELSYIYIAHDLPSLTGTALAEQEMKVKISTHMTLHGKNERSSTRP
jgi:hypothetical protein